MSKIRVITLAIIKREDPYEPAYLLAYDPKEDFYRPLGGGVEFGETSQEAVQRELQEELKADLIHLQYCGAVENIFTYDGEDGHEIVLVWQADLVDQVLYEQNELVGDESGVPFKVVWVPITKLKEVTVYPPDILNLCP